jgi:hypothetical protein
MVLSLRIYSLGSPARGEADLAAIEKVDDRTPEPFGKAGIYG